MKKTYAWTGVNGNKFELEAECTMKVKNVVLDADGIELETNRKEVIVNANLIAKADGKVIDTCRDINFWRVIDLKNGYMMIWGIDKIGFTPEKAVEIEAFLNEVIEGAKTEEVKELEANEAEEEKADEIKEAKEVIRLAGTSPKHEDGTLYSYEELKRYLKNYNTMFNEGDGYIPEYVCQEEYEKALAVINK